MLVSTGGGERCGTQGNTQEKARRKNVKFTIVHETVKDSRLSLSLVDGIE